MPDFIVNPRGPGVIGDLMLPTDHGQSGPEGKVLREEMIRMRMSANMASPEMLEQYQQQDRLEAIARRHVVSTLVPTSAKVIVTNAAGESHMYDLLNVHQDPQKEYEARLKDRHVFVLANDWTEILKEVIDTVQDDEVKLPYPECIFDFAFTEAQVMVHATQEAGGPLSIEIAWMPRFGNQTPLELPSHYHHYAPYTCHCAQVQGNRPELESDACPNCGQFPELDDLVLKSLLLQPEEFYLKHVKAACIALDVELASTPGPVDVYQMPDVAKEIKLRARLDKHHVLVLRPGKQNSRGGENTGRTQRMHFRRGHWRHYANGKIQWIRWCIAGRHELGAVIKSYKM